MYACMHVCMYLCVYVCIVVDCRELPTLLNGKVHVINTTYLSRVNFSCEEDYNLVGVSSTVCLANKSWSDEMPRCISKDECCCLLAEMKLKHCVVAFV